MNSATEPIAKPSAESLSVVTPYVFQMVRQSQGSIGGYVPLVVDEVLNRVRELLDLDVTQVSTIAPVAKPSDEVLSGATPYIYQMIHTAAAESNVHPFMVERALEAVSDLIAADVDWTTVDPQAFAAWEVYQLDLETNSREAWFAARDAFLYAWEQALRRDQENNGE